MRSHRYIVLALAAAILAAAALLARSLQPRPAFDWTNHFAVLGRAIAEETSRELGPHTAIVALRFEGANPMFDQTLEELRRAGAVIIAVETVPF